MQLVEQRQELLARLSNKDGNGHNNASLGLFSDGDLTTGASLKQSLGSKHGRRAGDRQGL